MPRSTMILGIVMLAAVATVLAQEPQPQPQPAPAPAAELKSFTGEIVSVDAAGRSFVAKEASLPSPAPPASPAPKPEAAGKSMTFTADDQTKITDKMDPAKTLKLDALKAGDRVTVKYSASAGKNLAKSVEVVGHGRTSSN